MTVRVEDIDRLQSDYGYGGTRHYMRSAGPSVDRAVVKAANSLGLTEEQFGEWLRSKLGRWYGEANGYFWKATVASNYKPSAADKFEAAKSSMVEMSELIARGAWN